MKAAGLKRWVALGAFATAVSLSTPALAASQHLGQRTLHQGMTGHDVRVLQQYLTFSGFRTHIDGEFGAGTTRHVLAFERHYGLTSNGVVDATFVNKIRSVVANKQGTQAIGDSTGGVSYTVPPSSTPAPSPGSAPTTTAGARGQVIDGLGVAPSSAPQQVKAVIAAANKIATKPYIYGGGHGSFTDRGYDCSGSVSYALHGGGLIKSPEDSGSLESYGSAGAGQWITLWTNSGHVFMYVAGMRFDTGAQSSNGGSRWTASSTSSSGYVERHPTGF